MSEVAYVRLVGLGMPASLLLCGYSVLFRREKTVWSALQFFGAGSLMVVVLTHVAETLQLFPSDELGTST